MSGKDNNTMATDKKTVNVVKVHIAEANKTLIISMVDGYDKITKNPDALKTMYGYWKQADKAGYSQLGFFNLYDSSIPVDMGGLKIPEFQKKYPRYVAFRYILTKARNLVENKPLTESQRDALNEKRKQMPVTLARKAASLGLNWDGLRALLKIATRYSDKYLDSTLKPKFETAYIAHIANKSAERATKAAKAVSRVRRAANARAAA